MEHGPLELSLQQKSNSPDKFWEGFLGQKVTQVARLLKECGNPNDPSVAKALEDALSAVPKSRQEFISKEELLLRSLELYATENHGFVSEKLEKGYIDAVAASLLRRFQEYDFDAVSEPLQEAIDAIVKDKGIILRDSAIDRLRGTFWKNFSARKTEEYETDRG